MTIRRLGGFQTRFSHQPDHRKDWHRRNAGVGQRNLKINGVLWSMNARDQLVQPSTPAGNNMTLTGATLSDWVTVS